MESVTADTYASLNVTVRIQEQALLGKKDYEALIQSPSYEGALALLESTPYSLNKETGNVEEGLIKRLQEAYQEAYKFSPHAGVIDLWGLRYTYHNLKVLFKEDYAQRDLSSMYLLLSKEEISSLKQAVTTGHADSLDPIILQAVRSVRRYINETGYINDISLLLDEAYLNHIASLAPSLENDDLQELVNRFIDLETLALILRAIPQGKGLGFLKATLNAHGTIQVPDLVAALEAKDLDGLFALFQAKDYSEDFASLLEGIKNAYLQHKEAFDLLDFDRQKNLLISQVLRKASLQAFGPLPVVAYLYFLENEVTNLRLILTAKASHLDTSKIKERMRPIYAE